MITLWIIIVILFGHWLADFVFQSHLMSQRKSKDWFVLFEHSLVITAGVFFVALFTVNISHHEQGVPAFAFANGAGHFAIDAVTSRITSRLYAKQDFHNFFVVIGFDQFLHVAMLSATWVAFFR